MTPSWLSQVLWWGAGVGGGGALWYFLSERNYHAAVWTGFGTGVVVLLAIALTFRDDLLRGKRQPAAANPAAEVTPSLTRRAEPTATVKTINPRGLTVERIVDEINSAPPYQKDSIATNFEGIFVKWDGKIWDIVKPLFSKPGSPDIEVQLHTGDSLYSIRFTVSIEKYPQFKVLKRGDPVDVSGTIKKCSGPGMFVELDVPDVTFPQ
jgi:hypothetical protein